MLVILIGVIWIAFFLAIYLLDWGSTEAMPALYFTVISTAIVGGLLLYAPTSSWGSDNWTAVAESERIELSAIAPVAQDKGVDILLETGPTNVGERISYRSIQEGGAFKIESVAAESSEIFHSDDDAYALIKKSEWKANWLTPFALEKRIAYEFHVPAGSIASSSK